MNTKNPDFNYAEFEEWLNTRPKIVKDMAAKIPPDRLYKLVTTGQICWPVAYAENGTCRVRIHPAYKLTGRLGLEVFGIDPNDLEPYGFEYPRTN